MKRLLDCSRSAYALLAAATLLCLPTHVAAASPQPNILFIMVDDLGKDWISCYGADNIQTPHIDQLAQTGLKFHNAYSMPQCTPTRVTLLTGQYPWRTGWVNHWDVPRWGVGYFDWERHTTFARVMKSAGYKTAIAGKWQINDFRIEPLALEKHGFDDWCVWTGYEGQNPPSAKRYWDPYIHTRQGSQAYTGKFGPDLYCDFLIEFMRRHRDDPMMLYFPMALTHGPLTPTPAEPDVKGRDQHAAMVRYTDLLVGRLVKAIDQLDLRERTIIIFTTDNGTGGGQLGTVAGQRPSGGKAKKHEGGVCEPFIVNCPGRVPAGAETDALTDFTDLLPTFAELGGVSLPDGLVVDGQSLAPVMLGTSDDGPRDWIMALGHGAARLDADGVRGVDDYADRVIRDQRYKVWVESNRAISAFYDLQTDPLEKQNLLGGPLPDQAESALTKFRKVLATLPANDARPQYRPRAAQAWDKVFAAQKKAKSPESPQKKRRRKKRE